MFEIKPNIKTPFTLLDKQGQKFLAGFKDNISKKHKVDKYRLYYTNTTEKLFRRSVFFLKQLINITRISSICSG